MSEKSIKVGVVSRHPISDANAMSGTPFQVFQALQRAGLDVIDLSPLDREPWPWRKLKKALRRIGIGPSDKTKTVKDSSEDDYKSRLLLAEKLSSDTQRLIDAADVDVVFGVCISTMLFNLNDKRPILYASDTTARLMNTTYDRWIKRSKGYHEANDIIERSALEKCQFFLPASKCAQESAIADYGMAQSKVQVIEFGAHVRPGKEGVPPVISPTRDAINLVLVAADPERKRLAFCVEVVECLRQRGWTAKLNYIGAKHELCDHPLVNYFGRLKLSEDSDRETHSKVMRNSHWMILPSKAEAFGIAPCEAAHFRRPSVVSDVGGLPTVVQDSVTGLVMGIDEGASRYADRIIEYSTDPKTYETMANAAFNRAVNVLSWDVWANRVKLLINKTCSNG